jgi:hypothetical protein
VAAQPSARERAELQKALEDERRRRNEDASLLRAEMEKLRADLLRLSDSAGSSRLTVAPPSDSNAAATASKPATVATAAPNQPTQTALAVNVSPAVNNSPANRADWDQRLAILQNLKGELTFGKALATLFNIISSEDLTLLVTLEKRVTRAGWASAHAIGADSGGNLAWAGVEQMPDATTANDSAKEFCSAGKSRRCHVFMVNGEFREKDFMELARELSLHNFSIARASYLDTLRSAPRETILRIGPNGMQSAKAFASAQPAF